MGKRARAVVRDEAKGHVCHQRVRLSRASMRAGSNLKVDSKALSKGRPRSKPSSEKWFGMLANSPH